MYSKKDIAKRIKNLREESGHNVNFMALRANVSYNTYKSYEDGKTDIPVYVLYDLAEYYNIHILELLEGKKLTALEEISLLCYGISESTKSKIIQTVKIWILNK